MTDIIVIAILAVILGAAVGYIYKTKKNGAKCIGCPAGTCSGACSSGCSHSCCCEHTDTTAERENP
ncbi:MAG: FeoB-associated Cys-rich membrane protein [Oscillibacter sp.]|nr:FeoB-associated Cys-rich membrane protein [Oscillibacter sp.]